jgi:uncharacterized protein
MSHKFAQLMFTEAAQKLQEQHGSRRQYEKMEKYGPSHDQLGPHEIDFIEARDSFYMASIGENDWPYVQHRGGPPGFLHVINERTLAFADYAGNKQYITMGNLKRNDRVTLFLMDYAHQVRLKIIGHAEVVQTSADSELAKKVSPADPGAKVERIIRIRVAAFDWNCPQHITPRYTQEDVERALGPLHQKMDEIEKENDRLKAELKEATS